MLAVRGDGEQRHSVVVAANPIQAQHVPGESAIQVHRLFTGLQDAGDVRSLLRELRLLAVDRPAAVDASFALFDLDLRAVREERPLLAQASVLMITSNPKKIIAENTN